MYFFLFLSLIYLVNCAPINDDNAMNYLMNFGYTNNLTLDLMTEEDKIESIKKFQNYANVSVTGFLDEETKQMMEKPRCRMPDFKIVYYSGRWNHSLLTYKFLNFPHHNFNESQVIKELTKAMKLWINEVDLLLEKIDNDDLEANIQIEFVDQSEFQTNEEMVFAYASPPADGDIYYVDKDWSDYDVDLYQIGVHEFGHSLGLEHSQDKKSVMYAIFEYKEDFKLDSSDIEQVQALYGVKYSLCRDGNIDAAVSVSKIVYIIRRSQIWKFFSGKLGSGYPKLLSKEWKGIEFNINAAVYYNNSFYFIREKNLLMHTNDSIKIFYIFDTVYDAAVVIGERLYTFKGFLYWRYQFTEDGMFIEKNQYPRNISKLWKGVPGNINAVYYDGDAHFFQNKRYFRFDTNAKYKVAEEMPISKWNGCL